MTTTSAPHCRATAAASSPRRQQRGRNGAEPAVGGDEQDARAGRVRAGVGVGPGDDLRVAHDLFVARSRSGQDPTKV
jgi:hypothetical protein